MSSELDFLRGKNYKVTEYITLNNPTLNVIADNGDNLFYSAIHMLCSTPSDYLVYLNDELNLDWEKISEYEWFTTVFNSIPLEGLNLVFDNFNINDFHWAINDKQNKMCLIDNDGTEVFNEQIYYRLTNLLRMLHGLEKNTRISGTQSAHDAIIRSERKKIKRQEFMRSRKLQNSILYPVISTLVNMEGFKYDYSTVWNLHIYQFTDSLKKTQKINYYNQLMTGIYTGSIDSKKINKDDLQLFGTI